MSLCFELYGFYLLFEDKSWVWEINCKFWGRSDLFLWICEVWNVVCMCFLREVEGEKMGLGIEVNFDDDNEMVFEWGWFLILELWDMRCFWWYYFDVMINVLNDSLEKLLFIFKKKKFFLLVVYDGFFVVVKEERDLRLISFVFSIVLGDDVMFYMFLCRVLERFFLEFNGIGFVIGLGGDEGWRGDNGDDDDVFFVLVMLSWVLMVLEIFERVRKWCDEFWKKENFFK